jgi:hypothetical protein
MIFINIKYNSHFDRREISRSIHYFPKVRDGAIFVLLELSRRIWLMTSPSPGGGEKMSKHSVSAGDSVSCFVGSLSSGARLRHGPAGTFPLSSFRRPVWMASGFTGCRSAKGLSGDRM